jgi:hypothetical protein
MTTRTHDCGGTVLVGAPGAGETEHRYCDRCGAYSYLTTGLPTGTDREANREAWDAGEDESPDAPSAEDGRLLREVIEAKRAWADGGHVGPLRMSGAAYRSIHPDFRSGLGEPRACLVLAPGGTSSIPVELTDLPRVRS